MTSPDIPTDKHNSKNSNQKSLIDTVINAPASRRLMLSGVAYVRRYIEGVVAR